MIFKLHHEWNEAESEEEKINKVKPASRKKLL